MLLIYKKMIDVGLILSVVSLLFSSFVVVRYHLDSECFGGGRISYDAEDEPTETTQQTHNYHSFRKHK